MQKEMMTDKNVPMPSFWQLVKKVLSNWSRQILPMGSILLFFMALTLVPRLTLPLFNTTDFFEVYTHMQSYPLHYGFTLLLNIYLLYLFGVTLLWMHHVQSGEQSSIVNHFILGLCRLPRLFLGWIYFSLLVVLGFIFFIVPGIYLFIGYALAFPFIAIDNKKPWEALKQSFRAMKPHWFKAAGIVFFFFLLYLVAYFFIDALTKGTWLISVTLTVQASVWRHIFLVVLDTFWLLLLAATVLEFMKIFKPKAVAKQASEADRMGASLYS